MATDTTAPAAPDTSGMDTVLQQGANAFLAQYRQRQKERPVIEAEQQAGQEEIQSETADIKKSIDTQGQESAELTKKMDEFNEKINTLQQERRKMAVYKAGELKRFMPIAIAFGALGTALTRGNVAYGLQAMASGLAGYATGKKEKYDTAYQAWSDSMNSVIGEANETIKASQQIMENNSYTTQQKIDLLKVLSINNAHLTSYLQKGDLEGFIKGIDQWAGAAAKFKKLHGEADKKLTPHVSNTILNTVNTDVRQMFTWPQDTTAPEYVSKQNTAAYLTLHIAQRANNLFVTGQAKDEASAADLAVHEAVAKGYLHQDMQPLLTDFKSASSVDPFEQ